MFLKERQLNEKSNFESGILRVGMVNSLQFESFTCSFETTSSDFTASLHF